MFGFSWDDYWTLGGSCWWIVEADRMVENLAPRINGIEEYLSS